MVKENGANNILSSTHERAIAWDNIETLLRIEKERYSYQRALKKIITGVFQQYVPVGTTIFEVGAGQGFLKDFVPPAYHSQYFTSDYNFGNLRAGTQRRDLQAVAASANNLPLKRDSIDVVIDMDAYDTIPNLQEAMDETFRVLRPDGKFIHFQANLPSDDTVWNDHPEMVFFPTWRGADKGPEMIGVKRDELEKELNHLRSPQAVQIRRFIDGFLRDQRKSYINTLGSPLFRELTEVIGKTLNIIPVDKFDIPTLHEYFKDKLIITAAQAGLSVTEAGYRGASIIVPRSDSQMSYPLNNEFSLYSGTFTVSQNRVLTSLESQDVVERANILVVVAKK